MSNRSERMTKRERERKCRKRLERKERNIERERDDVLEVIENDRKDERWKT